jgi:SAM-dependent methyltransferase
MKLIKKDYEQGYHENLLYREAQQSQRNQQRLRLVRERKAGGRLLEIGCGTGGFLRMARERYEVKGLDISKTAIDAIRAEFDERVQQGDLEQDALPVGSYDVIVVFNILEHLHRPAEAVQKLYGALAAGGLLVGSVPNNGGVVGSLVTRVGNYFDRTHCSTFAPERWQRIFHDSGFSPVDFFGEVTIGRNRCHYLTAPSWRQLAFNLMFVCEKPR